MIPLKDDVPTRVFPVVVVVLIAVNVLIYLYEFFLSFPADPSSRLARQAGERAFEDFVFEFGLVPCRVTLACPARLDTQLAGAPPPIVTVFTSMFVHGGLFHVAGNMLYLWVFGNSIEDSMGRGRFLLFYLACGVVAAVAQYLQNPTAAVPMVGASGAVSGVLGGYLLLFPHARVWTLLIFGFFWRVVPVPALLVLGLWIVVQALNGFLTFGSGEGGVAFLAHVGGFLAGMALIHLFRRRPPPSRYRWG